MQDRTEKGKLAMLEALEKTLGVVTTACKLVGISRESHYNWLEADEAYYDAVKSIDNVAIDFAESNLHKQIKKGSTSATIFYLKTKGKNRGYIEKQELDVSGEFKPINITLQIDDDSETDQ
tara:strand:- start:575 stop:937 length:363 start_codon:yes stop_codon:yes gene_type:complete